MWRLLCVLFVCGACLLRGEGKTLVVILGETRAHELTYDNIKKNLLDELQADLAICIGVKDDYDYDNPFYKNAKYRFLYKEPEDYGPAFDMAYEEILKSAPPAPSDAIHWREFLKIGDQYLGGIKDSQHQHPGSAGILIFYRWFLLKNLQENHVLDQYDYFIITRSDYLYQLPHPRLSVFSQDSIYIPDGEQYGGVTDRHVVLPRKFVVPYLNMLNNMVSRGGEYYHKMWPLQPFCLEKFIWFHLSQNAVADRVVFFPYVMYSVRPVNGTTRWSKGRYSQKLGYFIKYDSEYEAAKRHQVDYQHYQNRGGSLDAFYRERMRPAL